MQLTRILFYKEKGHQLYLKALTKDRNGEVHDAACVARSMGGKQPDGVTQSSATWMPRVPEGGLGKGRIKGYTQPWREEQLISQFK